jgi:hypothetical protein
MLPAMLANAIGHLRSTFMFCRMVSFQERAIEAFDFDQAIFP